MQMSDWLYWTIVVLSAGLLYQAAQWVRKADLPPWLYRKREDQKRSEIAVSDGWHYAEGQKTVGPLTLTEMQRVLSKVAEPRNLLVWKAGFEEWKRAGNVPELAQLIYKPPPLPGQVISPETPAAPTTKRREWKWHFLQGTLQVLILSGFAVSDGFWQWSPDNNKTFVILAGIGASWLLTVALPRKLGRDFAIRRIAVPVIVLGLGLLAYKYVVGCEELLSH
jgi:GYF domain 2